MRLVVTKRNSATATTGAPDGAAPAAAYDSYRERLVKYVPVEIIVLYVAVYGILYAVAGFDPWFSFTSFWLLVAGIMAVFLYLWIAEGISDGIQMAISIIGFVLFAFALGVIPLSTLPGYNQVIASVALPVYVFVSPLFEGVPDRW
jgi:hypothetical protein